MRRLLTTLPILTLTLVGATGCASRCQPACPPPPCGTPGVLAPGRVGYTPADDAFTQSPQSQGAWGEARQQQVQYRETAYRMPLR